MSRIPTLETLNAMLYELVDGVAYDLRNGDPPQSTIDTMVALYQRNPVNAAALLGAALVQLAELHNARSPDPNGRPAPIHSLPAHATRTYR